MSADLFETIYDQAIGWNLDPQSVRARVFGQLAVLANPTKMVIHQSDLYHDATWLRERFYVGSQFFYGVRESGTTIGLAMELTRDHNTEVYRVTCRKTNASKRDADMRYVLKIERLIRS